MSPRRASTKVPRPRTYGPGDRVQIRRAYGVTGIVVEVIRRSRPAFFGYLVELNGERREFPASCVEEPPRPLLDEWRRWLAEDLGPEFVALLPDERLAQLQREWAEVHPRLAERHPDLGPRRIPGVAPLHRVSINKHTETYEAFSSNGAHLRRRSRSHWWLRCPCGFLEVAESYADAKRRKEEHDTPMG